MRRDYFTLDVHGVEWVDTGGEPEQPGVVIDFEGPESLLRRRITDTDGSLHDASTIDVSFRLQTDVDDDDAMGVVSVTNRITGDFVLELNVEAEHVITFIRAARKFGKHAGENTDRYEITIRIDREAVATYGKQTFLVYDRDGELLRQHSLIPSGVEL